MTATVGVRRVNTGRRRYLISLAVMGALVCALGSTGLFAALTDSARTGTNHVDTAALPGAADLQLATAHVAPPVVAGQGSSIVCDEPFVEDLTTAGFNATAVTPGFATAKAWYCLKNVGSQSVNVAATIDSLSDVDLNCTGDEALYNDVTCGNQLEGELSSVLNVFYETAVCDNYSLPHADTIIQMTTNVGASPDLPWFTGLAPGEHLCIATQVFYPPNKPVDDVQRAQSDSVSWRFKFTGVAQP
jgi:hypothetical protein